MKPNLLIPARVERMLEAEYWYYRFGMAIGFLTWVLCAFIIYLGVRFL